MYVHNVNQAQSNIKRNYSYFAYPKTKEHRRSRLSSNRTALLHHPQKEKESMEV